MPLHPQAAALMELVASLGDPALEDTTPDQARAIRAAKLRPPTEPIAERREVRIGDVPCRLYRPSDQASGLLVYFHGGGWVLGDLDGHDNVCRALANRSDVSVLSVGYRLAPEHRYPAAVDDAVTSTRWALDHADGLGCGSGRIGVGGDSAGATLAAVVSQMGIGPIAHQLLIYPATDCRVSNDSHARFTNRFESQLTAAGMEWFLQHYLGDRSQHGDDPRVSPLLAPDHVVAATPPALVITAEFDPLGDEGRKYASRLNQLGVPTTSVHFGGMFHGFFNLAEFLDDAKLAIALAAGALRAALVPGADLR